MRVLATALLLFVSSSYAYGQEACPKEELDLVVSRFELLQVARDAKGALNFLIPPEAPVDVAGHSFLMGLDIFPDGSSPRLYSTAVTNFTLWSWKLGKIEFMRSHGFGFCIVEVEEQRQYQSQFANRGVSVEKKYLLLFNFKDGKGWEIASYQGNYLDDSMYSGWIK